MGLENSDAFLVNRSGTDYQESWENILSDVEVDLGIGSVTDELSTIRTDSGVGGIVLGATISNAGSGYTDGTFYNAPVTVITGRGTNLLLESVVYSGGSLVDFQLRDPGNSNVGIGFLEGDVIEHNISGTPWQLTITRVGNGSTLGGLKYGGFPLSSVYVPRDFTTLPFLP